MYILYHCGNCGRATISQTSLAVAACVCGRNAKKEILRSESPIAVLTLDQNVVLNHVEPAARPVFTDPRGATPEALRNARSGLRHVETAPAKTFGDARGVTPDALAKAKLGLRHADGPKTPELPKPDLTKSGNIIPMVQSKEEIDLNGTAVLIPGDKATAIVANDAVVKKLVHTNGTHMVVPKSLYAIFSKFTKKGKNPMEMDTNRNRVVAWTMVNQSRNMKVPAQTSRQIKFWMANQDKYGYKREDFGGRDLSKTLNRIAADLAAPTSGINAYDKKPFTNDRKHAFRLPVSASGFHGYNEYYVTHDSSAGRISGSKGAAGQERLVIGPPDKLFFTWHHYDEGSWFQFNWQTNAWTAL